ncbi:hypothetical protein V8C37DRAFT_126607 [Trichoderma ceciliae]
MRWHAPYLRPNQTAILRPAVRQRPAQQVHACMRDARLQDHACKATVSPLQEEMTESDSKPITSSLPRLPS